MRATLILTACLAATAMEVGGGEPRDRKGALSLTAPQKELLALEPILVNVAVEGDLPELPALPAEKNALRFEVKPAVKPRGGAKPLSFEAKRTNARTRLYDLLECFQFPAEGTFTVQAVIVTKDGERRSAPFSFTIHRPDKKDPEWGPVDRLHHIPWSNYVTDAFCGDTFDVVKRWPDSKLAKYCHYWNGLHHQHKKEYDKAIASFQNVEKYPDFILRPHARAALNECVTAQRQAALRLLKKFKEDVQKK
jgi:hypothetical protein